MTERALDPLTGLHECPWCAAPPSPCSTCFECVHEVISSLLRAETDVVVSALAAGGKTAREWHKRMSEGPHPMILSPCTAGDVTSVAGLTWAKRLEESSVGSAWTSLTAVAVGLLVVFLVLSLMSRVS